MQDFIDSKREKKSKNFAFSTPKEKLENYNWEEKENLVKAFTEEADRRKWYNDDLRNLDPLYTSLKPLDGYIVRISVKEYVQSDSGLLLVSQEMTQSIRPGSTTPGDPIRNPYDFDSTAVIVAVPSYEQFLKPGMLVQIVRPRPEVMADQVVHYENGYAHPDYKLGELPKSPTSRHFGYALIPYQKIKVVLDESVASLSETAKK